MKRLFSFALLFALVGPTSAALLTGLVGRSSSSPAVDEYTTSFPLTENPISEGGMWTGPNGTGFTNVRTASGNAFGTGTNTPTYDDSYAYLTGFGNDYEIEAVIHRGSPPAQNHEVELELRLSEVAGETYLYEILFNLNGGPQVVRWNGWDACSGEPCYDITDLTGLGSGSGCGCTPSNGDTIYASIVGQLITVKYNGSTVWTYTDNAAEKLTTGDPGIGFFYRTSLGATPSTFGLQSVTVRAL